MTNTQRIEWIKGHGHEVREALDQNTIEIGVYWTNTQTGQSGTQWDRVRLDDTDRIYEILGY